MELKDLKKTAKNRKYAVNIMLTFEEKLFLKDNNLSPNKIFIAALKEIGFDETRAKNELIALGNEVYNKEIYNKSKSKRV